MISTVLLIIIGLITLYSASSIQPGHGDFKRQLVGIIIAIPFFLIFFLFDPRIWAYYSRAVYMLAILLLVSVMIPGLGRTGGGATRWLDIGPIQLQPSEIVKLLLVLTLADLMSRMGSKIRTWPGLTKTLMHVLPLFILVAIQPSLSTSLVFLCIWFGMSIMAGQKIRNLVLVVIASVVAFGAAWQFGFIRDYQKGRVYEFISGESGFHSERAQLTVAMGKVIGEGFGQGSLKEGRFVPEPTTDFIFTVLAEELGFVGSTLVLLLYAFFLWRIWLVAMLADIRFFRLIATGIFIIFSFHTLVNLLVVVGILPVTGVPLPFMSFGRSAMLLNLMSIALLLNLRGREKQLVF